MTTYARIGGGVLRQLRKKRSLTLQDAAPRFTISVAALSRKERGVDQIGRQDIRHAIRVYRLSPAETAELWAAAGLLPDPPTDTPVQVDMQAFAGPLLINVLFPAFVTDSLGYIVAWNQAIEYMWQFGSSLERPPHVLSAAFSPRVRAVMGDNWPQAIRAYVGGFYRDTLARSGHPDYARIIRMLEERHGNMFVRIWNEAGQRLADPDGDPISSLDGTRAVFRDGNSEIEYLMMQSVFRFSSPYFLVLYVPFGPQNHIRYEALSAEIGPRRVYFAEEQPPSDRDQPPPEHDG